MKITGLKFLHTQKNNFKKQTNTLVQKQTNFTQTSLECMAQYNKAIVFKGSYLNFIYSPSSFIYAPSSLSTEEYKRLKNKNILKKYCEFYLEQENSLRVKPKDMINYAKAIKKEFDEKYKNYTIISAGTSPSALCDVMGYLGCDVIRLPASNVTEILLRIDYNYGKFAKQYRKYDNLITVLKYLKHKGVENDDSKKYIVMDFCSTGASLECLCNAIELYFGMDPEQLKRCDMLETLYKSLYSNTDSKFDSDTIESLRSELISEKIEKISNTPHFDVFNNLNNLKNYHINPAGKTEKEIFKEFDNFSRPGARMYNFLVLSQLDANNELP